MSTDVSLIAELGRRRRGEEDRDLGEPPRERGLVDVCSVCELKTRRDHAGLREPICFTLHTCAFTSVATDEVGNVSLATVRF